MAVLEKVKILSNKLLVNKIPAIYIIRNCSKMEKFVEKMIDLSKPSAYVKYMPGHYPETEEERIKAAAKYGLHPYEYKPLPIDSHAGDYPDLPWISDAAKDPFYPWDYPGIRRNYEEPFHVQFDLLGEDRYDYGVRTVMTPVKGTLIFLATMAGFFFLHYISPYTSVPRLEKQYPGHGVHYTFEPAK